MEDEERFPGQVSPVNPAAVRGPSGIWNEETLPIMEWEVPEQRKVIPKSVQHSIRRSAAVIRVSIDIDRKQRSKHRELVAFYEAFDMEGWIFVREIRDVRGSKWEFVQIVDEGEGGPWPLMFVLGHDERGSLNLVSLHRRNRRWMRKLLEGELDFVMRRK